MPVCSSIAGCAGDFHKNTGCFERAVAGLTPEQWLARPNDRSNHITWITGHLLWARHALVTYIGGSWLCPDFAIFARGAKLDPSSAYPEPAALVATWQESDGVLAAALESLTPEALAAPAPPRPPTPDGKVSGFISVLAWHETYHLGQVAYLRSWLGQPGLFG